MKQPKISAIGRQKKALAIVCKSGFSGEKIVDNSYFRIDKRETRNGKTRSGKRLQGPQMDLKAGRVMVRM